MLFLATTWEVSSMKVFLASILMLALSACVSVPQPVMDETPQSRQYLNDPLGIEWLVENHYG